MPRIEWMSRPRESLVNGWRKLDCKIHPDFPTLRPRVQTIDMYSMLYGPQPFRYDLHNAQIFTDQSRKQYQSQYQKVLKGIQDGRAVQVRWRVSKEVPSFSVDFLKLYLTRYGKVEAIHQLSHNSCLAIFANEQTMRSVLACRTLGLPYGRLIAKSWNPEPQDHDFHRVIRHLEAAASTHCRFNSMMDHDDRLAYSSPARHATRVMAMNNRAYGPALKYYLVGDLKNWKKPTKHQV